VPIVDYLVARHGLPPRSGVAYDYVLAGDGLYLVSENAHLRVRVPVARCRVRGLAPVYASWCLLHGLLPSHCWETMLRVARSAATAGREVLLMVGYDATFGYQVMMPQQVVGPASVRYRPADDLVMELHSHRDGAARFSSTDTADEQRLRLYGVVGRLDRLRPEVSLRVGVYGAFMPVPWASIFDGNPAGVRDAQFDPPEEDEWAVAHTVLVHGSEDCLGLLD
jgi:PRTRC genetic system protein A